MNDSPVYVAPAEVHTDDFVIQVRFDAEPWFRQADDSQILELARCGYGGDYPADDVARFFENTNTSPEIRRLFEYLDVIRNLPEKKDCCGFECHVDAMAAKKWILSYRPGLYELLSNANG